jgi:hypothetical protein
LAKIQVDSYLTNYAGILPAEYLELFCYADQEQDWQDWFAADSGEVLTEFRIAIQEVAYGWPDIHRLVYPLREE